MRISRLLFLWSVLRSPCMLVSHSVLLPSRRSILPGGESCGFSRSFGGARYRDSFSFWIWVESYEEEEEGKRGRDMHPTFFCVKQKVFRVVESLSPFPPKWKPGASVSLALFFLFQQGPEVPFPSNPTRAIMTKFISSAFISPSLLDSNNKSET